MRSLSSLSYYKCVLSIVIIARNNRDLLQSLLASIEADSSLLRYDTEIIVVDNGSTDGTDAMLAPRFPRVRLVRNEENRGFAAAVNLGYRRSTGEFVLLLNSDTRLIPGELSKMLDYMAREDRVGIVGPQLVYEDLRPQRSFALTPSLALERASPFLARKAASRQVQDEGEGCFRSNSGRIPDRCGNARA